MGSTTFTEYCSNISFHGLANSFKQDLQKTILKNQLCCNLDKAYDK